MKNEVDDILKGAKKSDIGEFHDLIEKKLKEIIGSGPEFLIDIPELFGAAVALKMLIVQFIDPTRLLDKLGKDKSQIRRVVASIEAMTMVNEIEKKCHNVIEDSIENMIVNNPDIDDKIKKVFNLDESKEEQDVRKELEKITKGATDVFKSTEPGKA